MKRFILVLMAIVGLCSPVLGQSGRRQDDTRRYSQTASDWKTYSQKVIANAGKVQQLVDSLLQREVPDGASAEYRAAWSRVVRKAKEVQKACANLMQRVQLIKGGDTTKQSTDELGKLLQKYTFAYNGLMEALNGLPETSEGATQGAED